MELISVSSEATGVVASHFLEMFDTTLDFENRRMLGRHNLLTREAHFLVLVNYHAIVHKYTVVIIYFVLQY